MDAGHAMDKGAVTIVDTEAANPKAVSSDQCQSKVAPGRLPLKALAVGSSVSALATKRGSTKRKLSEDGSAKPCKVRRKGSSSAAIIAKASRRQNVDLNSDPYGICHEVTSSCDSDKLLSASSGKIVGPLDGYTCILPEPDRVGVSSTIEENPKRFVGDVAHLDSDDEYGDGSTKQLNESHTSTSTVSDVQSPQQSSPASATKDTNRDLPGGMKRLSKGGGGGTVKEREQKRILREEKKKQKAVEKTEKLKRIQEEKEKREQEKLTKETERKLKQEVKERERQEKLLEKEEKKKRKSEVELKLLEEKRRKDDEKQKVEEEKLRQQQAQKNLMFKFLKKIDKVDQQPSKQELSVESVVAVSSRFRPFQVKEGMKLPPLLRRQITPAELGHLDAALNAQAAERLYTDDLKDAAFSARKSSATAPRVYQDDEVRVMEVDQTGVHMLKKKRYMKAKLLQFAENNRPAYYGTWRKASSAIGPRRPFAHDYRLLNYEIDSDEEWDEEEPGESTSVKDDDEEDGNDEGEESDVELKDEGFLVEHGYLSDGEGANDDDEEEDGTLEQRKEKQRLLNRLDWEQKKRRQRHTRDTLRPIIVGCYYDDGNQEAESHSTGEIDTLRRYQAYLYCPLPIPTAKCNPELRPADGEGVGAGCGSTPGPDCPGDKIIVGGLKRSGGSGKRGPECRVIPEEAIPDLIRLVHGNTLGLQHIVKEFVSYWKQQSNSQHEGSSIPSSEDKRGLPQQPFTAAEPGCGASPASAPTAHVLSPDGSFITSAGESPNGDSTVPNSSALSASNDRSRKISKRQLAFKVRAMAVYEKRSSYNRSCWYVHEDLISRYFGDTGLRNRCDLVIPTTWTYVTRQQQVHSSKKSTKPKPESAAEALETTPGVLCATPRSGSGASARHDAKPSPGRSTSTAPAGLTPITNFTIAKACQPRRIVPVAVSAPSGIASAKDEPLPLNKDVPHDSVPNGKAQTAGVAQPQSPGQQNVEASSQPVARRRVTLTTLYSALPCATSPSAQLVGSSKLQPLVVLKPQPSDSPNASFIRTDLGKVCSQPATASAGVHLAPPVAAEISVASENASTPLHNRDVLQQSTWSAAHAQDKNTYFTSADATDQSMQPQVLLVRLKSPPSSPRQAKRLERQCASNASNRHLAGEGAMGLGIQPKHGNAAGPAASMRASEGCGVDMPSALHEPDVMTLTSGEATTVIAAVNVKGKSDDGHCQLESPEVEAAVAEPVVQATAAQSLTCSLANLGAVPIVNHAREVIVIDDDSIL